MVLGYVISPFDNKYSMYRNFKLNECDKYSNNYIINRIDPEITIKTKKHFSSTYDNFTIVSEPVKEFCEQETFKGLEFVTLPNSPGFYWLKIHNVIELDKNGHRTGFSGIRFINYNEKCNGYESIIGGTPTFLKVKELIRMGFFVAICVLEVLQIRTHWK